MVNPLQEHVFAGDFRPLQAPRCGLGPGSAMEESQPVIDYGSWGTCQPGLLLAVLKERQIDQKPEGVYRLLTIKDEANPMMVSFPELLLDEGTSCRKR